MLGLWLPEEQHGQFARAAKAEGMTLSDWLRDLGARKVAQPLSEVRLGGFGGMDIEIAQKALLAHARGEETVESGHSPAVLEHAARAEAPFGRSATAFLLENTAKVGNLDQNAGLPADLEPGDPFEARCRVEFGEKVMLNAAKYVPRWAKMTWEQRHEALVAKKEAEGGIL